MGGANTVLNFGAGPAKLPQEVLKEVQEELLQYGTSEISVMEMSHRSKEFGKINKDAQLAIKELLNVPDNYKILFLQGGGTGLFAAIAMNLLNRTGTADYIVTGTWSAKAAKEATKYGKVNLVTPKPEKFIDIAEKSTWNLDPNASYLYYCANETVDGVEFPFIPETHANIPIVTDMSSSIMTAKVDVSRFGVIFGGAQKNIGPSGVTVAIVREDLIGNAMTICPSIFDFKNIADNNSLHNTPSTFPLYVMGRVLEWIKRNGGIDEMEKQSELKSKLLYQAMEDSNGFYSCPIKPRVRSRINIPFRVGFNGGNESLEDKFLEECEKQSMYQLKGHRTVGGLRASLYNAVSYNDVILLTKFMKEFQKKYGAQ